MAGREDLHNFDVFVAVALYFLGVVVVLLSVLTGRFLGGPTGVLLMVVGFLYERMSMLEVESKGGGA